MINDLNRKIIKQLYLFQNKSEQFKGDILPLLQHFKLFYCDFLFIQGDVIREMYFVITGSISFFIYDLKGLENEISEAKKSNFIYLI